MKKMAKSNRNGMKKKVSIKRHGKSVHIRTSKKKKSATVTTENFKVKNQIMGTRPKFIVVEGGEGSGKSSLLIALKEALGDTIITTREPGGSEYAELIRTAALKNPLAKTAPAETTLCLMFAARYDNLKNMIVPALELGVPVISDRFDASSYTYNVHAQSDGVLEELFWRLRHHLSHKPDLYIFIDVEPEEGVRRANRRNQSLLGGKKYDHFDDREISFHRKVRDGYKKFFDTVPHLVIDSNRPFEKVKEDFILEIRKQLGM